MREGSRSSTLTTADFDRVFAVLERVDTAATVSAFRERTMEAFGSVLGYRHTTFFRGTTYAGLFEDSDPLLTGRMRALMPEYRSGWRRHDVFSLPESTSLLTDSHAASVSELRSLPRSSREYLDDWLGRRGLCDVNAVYLRPGGDHALLGVFGSEGTVRPRDLAVLRLLGRQLSALSRHLPGEQAAPADLGDLPPRQQQVAELVCEGLTNVRIGRTLGLTEGTVKKYVSRILAATGCRSRTELVLALRARR